MQITNTPWGEPDSVDVIGPGVVFVSTPSHGGYFLDKKQNARVPEAWRKASFNGQAVRGWYEEDFDACMVPLCLPEFFSDGARSRAQGYFDLWIKPNLQA